MNIFGVGEHVGGVERSNTIIKEHTICHMYRLLYIVYPIEIVCGCVFKSVKDLNTDISSGSISDVLSPGTLITGGVSPRYNEIQALNFRDYI